MFERLKNKTEFEKLKVRIKQFDCFDIEQIRDLEKALVKAHPETWNIETVCNIRKTALKLCRMMITQNVILHDTLKD